MDITPTGKSTYLTLDTTADSAHSVGTNGHYAGSITLKRLHYLLIAHTRVHEHFEAESMSTPIVQTSQHILNTVTRAIPTFSEAIHSLLLRKDIHRPEKISKNPLTCTATLLHPNTIQQLATAFNIQHEWLADPLTHCP